MEKIVGLVLTILCIIAFCGCSNQQAEETAEDQTSADVSVSIPESRKITGTAEKTAKRREISATRETTVSVKSYSHSDKAFRLKDCTTSLFMVNGWEIFSGGTATNQQCDEITSFPAVLRYLDTKTTLTITVADEVEEKEEFLAGTEETYIAAYGTAYDSIDITEFKQITIDEFDSFIIKANVVIKGESFTMIHVISNDVSGKTFSWMLLDSDGEFDDFDLVEAICYPKIIDTSKFKRFDRENYDDLYKFNIDDFVN